MIGTISRSALRKGCVSQQLLQHALVAYHRHQHTTCVPVVIAGAGPTGLVLSSLLSLYGVRHVVLEKGASLTDHPQAHYVNNRTMEVFRGLSGLSQQVSRLSPPLEQWRRFVYCESMLTGQLLGEVDHFPGQAQPLDAAVSPEPVAHLSQHKLAQLLLRTAQELGRAQHNAIAFSSQVTSISTVQFHHQQPPQPPPQPPPPQQQQASSGAVGRSSRAAILDAAAAGVDPVRSLDDEAHTYPVCVAVRGTGTAHEQQHHQQQLIRCSYLVAADGSHSTIRQLLGVPLAGQAAMQHLISIHFTWPDLGAALLRAGRGAMLYFVFNRQVVAVLVGHNLEAGEFVAQVPFFPPLQSLPQFTPDVCRQIILQAAGLDSPQQPVSAGSLQLHTVKSWVMSAEVAEQYSDWGDRVLLAGDAAHKFPPAGGFGMNTGIQDAHNLAWKLAAVLRGAAAPALLASYGPERRPVAAANAALSISNWHEALRVPQALGLHPGAAALLNAAVSAAPLPAGLAGWLLDAGLAAGRSLAAAAVPLRRGALQDILARGLSLRLQFPREDLGFVYTQGAVAPTADRQGPPGSHQQQRHADGGSSSSRSRSGYEPSTAVGGRLPPAWLRVLQPGDTSIQEDVSTLDLVMPERLGLNMLLLCSSGGGRDAAASNSSRSSETVCQGWVAAGVQLQAEGWPLQVVNVLPQGVSLQQAAAVSARPAAGEAAAQQLGSCPVLAEDVSGMWERLHPGGGSVALLVRPDGHIAWRLLQAAGAAGDSSSSCSSAAMQQELRAVLRDVLHLVPRAVDQHAPTH